MVWTNLNFEVVFAVIKCALLAKFTIMHNFLATIRWKFSVQQNLLTCLRIAQILMMAPQRVWRSGRRSKCTRSNTFERKWSKFKHLHLFTMLKSREIYTVVIWIPDIQIQWWSEYQTFKYSGDLKSDNSNSINFFFVLYVFQTPPPLPGVPLGRFHSCRLVSHFNRLNNPYCIILEHFMNGHVSGFADPHCIIIAVWIDCVIEFWIFATIYLCPTWTVLHQGLTVVRTSKDVMEIYKCS